MKPKLRAALIALADALAELPAKEIIFAWFRGGYLVSEVHDLLARRHPRKERETDRVFEHWQRARRSNGARKAAQTRRKRREATDPKRSRRNPAHHRGETPCKTHLPTT